MTTPPISSRGDGRSLALDPAPRLVLRHPVFTTFDHPFFRIPENGIKPVLVIRLDDREASLTVAGLIREFGIGVTDPDGVMLGLVTRALAFVSALRIGDRLPAEVLSGDASWDAGEVAQERAVGRLNKLLLAWTVESDHSKTREMIYTGGELTVNPEMIVADLHCLSEQLGGITPVEALARIQRVAAEFAHIEALREELLHGAQRLGAVLNRTTRTFRGDQTHRDLLMQVRRLAVTGIADLEARFAAADLLIADIRQVVNRPDSIIAAIRDHRDELHARGRAWEPYNLQWNMIEVGHNSRTWHLAYETYRFLAPRFMTTVEWLSTPESASAPTERRSGMVW